MKKIKYFNISSGLLLLLLVSQLAIAETNSVIIYYPNNAQKNSALQRLEEICNDKGKARLPGLDLVRGYAGAKTCKNESYGNISFLLKANLIILIDDTKPLSSYLSKYFRTNTINGQQMIKSGFYKSKFEGGIVSVLVIGEKSFQMSNKTNWPKQVKQYIDYTTPIRINGNTKKETEKLVSEFTEYIRKTILECNSYFCIRRVIEDITSVACEGIYLCESKSADNGLIFNSKGDGVQVQIYTLFAPEITLKEMEFEKRDSEESQLKIPPPKHLRLTQSPQEIRRQQLNVLTGLSFGAILYGIKNPRFDLHLHKRVYAQAMMLNTMMNGWGKRPPSLTNSVNPNLLKGPAQKIPHSDISN